MNLHDLFEEILQLEFGIAELDSARLNFNPVRAFGSLDLDLDLDLNLDLDLDLDLGLDFDSDLDFFLAQFSECLEK
jgi:hypothetical protein